MTGPELEAIVAAMTERPWLDNGHFVEDEENNVIARCHDARDIGDGEHNATAIVALANAAAPLAALVKACEALERWSAGHGVNVPAVRDVIEALAAVHEVRHG